MHSAATAHIIRKHARAIRDNTRETGSSFDFETIHHLRTGCKKLRAFLRFYNSAHHTAYALPRKMKKLYAIAGTIRDAQIQLLQVLSSGNKALGPYALWLSNRIADGQAQWKKAYDPAVARRMDRSFAARKWKNLGNEDLERFFNTKMAALSAIATIEAPDDEALHSIRKEVKDMQYISRICEQHPEAGLNAVAFAPAAVLEELSQKAGDYNDRRNAADTFAHYLETLDEVPDELRLLHEEYEADNRAHRARLLEHIHAFRSGHYTMAEDEHQ